MLEAGSRLEGPQWGYNLDQTGKEFISYLKLPRFFLTAQVPLFSDEILFLIQQRCKIMNSKIHSKMHGLPIVSWRFEPYELARIPWDGIGDSFLWLSLVGRRGDKTCSVYHWKFSGEQAPYFGHPTFMKLPRFWPKWKYCNYIHQRHWNREYQRRKTRSLQ